MSQLLNSAITTGKHLSVQFSSVAQSCPTLCDPMNHSMSGLPVHHQLSEFTQTHVHWVGDAIQPSHPLSSPSPPTFNLSQHQGLFKWVIIHKGMVMPVFKYSFLYGHWNLSFMKFSCHKIIFFISFFQLFKNVNIIFALRLCKKKQQLQCSGPCRQ